MIDLITFCTFKEKYSTEDLLKDKELFFEAKKAFLSHILYYYSFNVNSLNKEEISQMDNLIKKIKYENKPKFVEGLSFFLIRFGLLYKCLSKEEKEELFILNYTYEECKKAIAKIYDNFIFNSKKNLPPQVYICFDEKCFIAYCQTICETAVVNKKNFLKLIRNYFILDEEKETYEEYRNQQLFKQIQEKMIKIYPELKNTYGINRYLDKFFSHLDPENDYNNTYIKNILDQYYNNKKNLINNNDVDNNEYTPLKEKSD